MLNEYWKTVTVPWPYIRLVPVVNTLVWWGCMMWNCWWCERKTIICMHVCVYVCICMYVWVVVYLLVLFPHCRQGQIICFYLNQTHYSHFHTLAPTILMEEIFAISLTLFAVFLNVNIFESYILLYVYFAHTLKSSIDIYL